MKKLLIAFLMVPLTAFASGPELLLDRAPDRLQDTAALQHGAQIYVNYCLNCHGASYMRYNRLRDIGLTELQIKDNLMFTAEKVGEPMHVVMRREDAKQWFGVAPPDLTLIARARSSELGSGGDWLYTYLRSFYRDDSRPTGWNNAIFTNVAMPHVLWGLQGEQVMGADHKLKLVKAGKLKPEEYDNFVGDLVAYLQFMGEPVAGLRKQLGVIVLIFLAIFFVFAYALKREFWKDVH
jgi:ubiquinol-cytochrome c reductase cytochrome c1 subunit